jgi:hypothetical protein
LIVTKKSIIVNIGFVQKNDKSVFISCIQGLKAEHEALTEQNDPFWDLKKKQEEIKKKKNK